MDYEPEPRKSNSRRYWIASGCFLFVSLIGLIFALNNSSTPAPTSSPIFTHSGVITSEFWVGEPADADNGYIANTASTWDEHWQQHYGGVDSPNSRNGYLPAAFTPYENSFYIALPYSDFDSEGNRKSSGNQCLKVSNNQATDYSWCKNTWIALRYNGKIAYAQWEDAGPFGEDDTAYVFGNAAPKNTVRLAAGLDVSPAITTYLGLHGDDKLDWALVTTSSVPSGPWKQTITTTPGEKAN